MIVGILPLLSCACPLTNVTRLRSDGFNGITDVAFDAPRGVVFAINAGSHSVTAIQLGRRRPSAGGTAASPSPAPAPAPGSDAAALPAVVLRNLWSGRPAGLALDTASPSPSPSPSPPRGVGAPAGGQQVLFVSDDVGDSVWRAELVHAASGAFIGFLAITRIG